jgi:hypothetical protein
MESTILLQPFESKVSKKINDCRFTFVGSSLAFFQVKPERMWIFVRNTMNARNKLLNIDLVPIV